VNLAEVPEQQRLKGELLEKVQAFQKATKDPWFRRWSYE
jgi:hypothetical protein